MILSFEIRFTLLSAVLQSGQQLLQFLHDFLLPIPAYRMINNINTYNSIMINTAINWSIKCD